MTTPTEIANPDAPSLRDGLSPSVSQRPWRHYLLAMMTLSYTINYMDRAIFSVLAQPIKTDLHLSDSGVALVGGVAFGLLYATMGLPFARHAERRSRVALMALALTTWSLMTSLCGLTTSLWQLFLARLGVGVGEAGCNPTAQSMISDVYPPDRRSTALAVYSLGIPIGTLLGAFLGGWIGQTFGWRTAFILLGMPGVVIALLILKTVREPVRGAQDVHFDASGETPSLRAAFAVFWRSRTIRHLAVSFTVCGLGFYALNGFVVAYALRRFGVSLIDASLAFGLIAGSTGFVGLLFGGVVADWLGKHDKRWYGWVPAIAHLLAGPLFIWALSQRSVGAMALGFIAPATLCLMYVGPGFAMTHNLVAPRIRATAVAILIMISTLIGMTLGPTLAGAISDLVGHRGFVGDFETLCRAGAAAPPACRIAEAGGLRVGLMCASAFYLWSAAHFVFAARNYRKELAAITA